MKCQLKTLRESKKMTQQQLADLIGCTRENISRIENNKGYTHYPTLSKIADKLGVNVSDIFLA
jgi:transcriptional regulator with XRE-family HTH domain